MKISITFNDCTKEQVEHLITFAKSLNFPEQPKPAATITPPETVTPAAPVQPETPAVTGNQVECDSRGVPFNSNFHLNKKTAKGAWASRRNIDKAAKEEYENRYLNETPAVPTPPAALTETPAANLTPAPVPPAVPVVPEMNPAPVAPVAPEMPAPPEFSPIDYGTFVTSYQTAVQSGKIKAEDLSGYLSTQGIAIVELNTNPEKLQIANAWLQGQLSQAS